MNQFLLGLVLLGGVIFTIFILYTATKAISSAYFRAKEDHVARTQKLNLKIQTKEEK